MLVIDHHARQGAPARPLRRRAVAAAIASGAADPGALLGCTSP
jgi:hypothetical protein